MKVTTSGSKDTISKSEKIKEVPFNCLTTSGYEALRLEKSETVDSSSTVISTRVSSYRDRY